jgi:hypothetical protein
MKRYLFAVLCVFPLLAQAEIYKSVDADGHVTYSSTPIKGGKKLNLEPLPTMLPPGKEGSPGSFPRVDSATQKSRDDTRYTILQNELTNEEKLLAEAKQSLAEASPEVFKGQDGKTYRNVAKYDEKIKPLAAQVDLHQKNIEALNTELSKLK